MNRFLKFLASAVIFFIPAVMAESANSLNSEPLDYNFSSTYSVPINLSITEDFSTKEPINEGGHLQFKIVEDVFVQNNKILSAGTIVNAKLETIVTSGMNGFPAEIVISNFEIPEIKSSQLMQTYTQKGTNRCFWVYPLKWALTPIPFVGSLTNLIKGGHAKITTSDVITIFYYPDWN